MINKLTDYITQYVIDHGVNFVCEGIECPGCCAFCTLDDVPTCWQSVPYINEHGKYAFTPSSKDTHCHYYDDFLEDCFRACC